MEDVELTAQEAARALGLHLNTVLRLAKAGELNGARLAYGVRSKGYVIPDKAVLERAKQGKAGQSLKAEAVIKEVKERRRREAADILEDIGKIA
jgi:excisionase family DNA binding protein